MDDSHILELFWHRDEQAIRETQQKYGAYCTTIANNVLLCPEDSQECVQDALLRLWDAFTAGDVAAADPDVQQFCTFYARLSDGTSVPVTGGSSVYNESRRVNECEFYWSTPIDLTALESIAFSDGSTEIEIPLS